MKLLYEENNTHVKLQIKLQIWALVNFLYGLCRFKSFNLESYLQN